MRPVDGHAGDLRGRAAVLGFTGLIPLVLMVPILLLKLYALDRVCARILLTL